MIFRDKTTGTLLNIRRDEYPNDRLYFQQIIGVVGGGGGEGSNRGLLPSAPRRFSRSFNDVHRDEL
jgi:hypothetical protein